MDRDSDDDTYMPPVDEDERTAATKPITTINDVPPILDSDKSATEEVPPVEEDHFEYGEYTQQLFQSKCV